MGYCTQCGKKLEEGEQKCTNCGEIVKEAIEDNELNRNKTPLFQDNQHINFLDKLKNKLIIIVSVVIFCLILGGIGVAKYTNASHVKEGITLGNKYLQEGKYEEAILAFKKVIQIEPKNIEARVGLAKVYVKTGKPHEAEKILKEVISINPKEVEPYLELAKLYISENNSVNAIKILTDGYKATNDESIKSMLENLKSKITVDNVNKTITLGENYSLPKEVTVKINNVEVQFPVKWDKTTAVDTTKVGTHTFNGTLENTDKIVKLTLNVIAIASIEDINSTVHQNDNYSLPSEVTAKMTDGSTREVEVTWSPSNVDTSKGGTYSYQGTVSGYSNKIKLNLNVESLPTDAKQTIINNVAKLGISVEIAVDAQYLDNKYFKLNGSGDIYSQQFYVLVYKGGNAVYGVVNSKTGELYIVTDFYTNTDQVHGVRTVKLYGKVL